MHTFVVLPKATIVEKSNTVHAYRRYILPPQTGGTGTTQASKKIQLVVPGTIVQVGTSEKIDLVYEESFSRQS